MGNGQGRHPFLLLNAPQRDKINWLRRGILKLMFAKRLHAILIGTIIACPALCNVGICDCGDKPQNEINCCSTCETAPVDNQPSAPSDEPTDEPCKRQCQCFCGGGILSQAFDYVLRIEIVDTLDVLGPNSTEVCFAVGQSDFFSRNDACVLSGRQVRFLNMSLLC